MKINVKSRKRTVDRPRRETYATVVARVTESDMVKKIAPQRTKGVTFAALWAITHGDAKGKTRRQLQQPAHGPRLKKKIG